MEKVGKNEFVYLWITGVERLDLYDKRCSLVSGTPFFYQVLTDLHTSYIKCIAINFKYFLFLS